MASDSRRQRLETIKQREDLKDELVHKFRDRFGSSQRNRPSDEASLNSVRIRQEVDRFVGSSAAVTESNIERLERRLRHQAQGKPGVADSDTMSQYSVSGYSSYTVGSVPPSVSSRRTGSITARGPLAPRGRHVAPETPGSLSARGVKQAPSIGDSASVGDAAYEAVRIDAAGGSGKAAVGASLEWSVLDKLAAQLHKHDAVRQVQNQKELQSKIKRDLDRQLEDERLKKERERDEERKYADMLGRSQEQWQADEQAKERAKHEKIFSEREHQMAQIEAVRHRIEGEKMLDKQEASDMMQKIERDIETDRQKAEQKLQNRKGNLKSALDISSQSLQMRDEKEKMLAQRENMSVETYAQMKEMREKAAKKDKAKEAGQREVMALVAADRAEAERLREQEAKAKIAVERTEKDRLSEIRDKHHQDKLAATRLETQEFLRKQMEEKQNLKQSEEEKTRRFRERQEADAANFVETEQQRVASRKLRYVEHRTELEKQISSKVPLVSGKECMSEVELRMNKKLLENVSRALTEISTSPFVVA